MPSVPQSASSGRVLWSDIVMHWVLKSGSCAGMNSKWCSKEIVEGNKTILFSISLLSKKWPLYFHMIHKAPTLLIWHWDFPILTIPFLWNLPVMPDTSKHCYCIVWLTSGVTQRRSSQNTNRHRDPSYTSSLAQYAWSTVAECVALGMMLMVRNDSEISLENLPASDKRIWQYLWESGKWPEV